MPHLRSGHAGAETRTTTWIATRAGHAKHCDHVDADEAAKTETGTATESPEDVDVEMNILEQWFENARQAWWKAAGGASCLGKGSQTYAHNIKQDEYLDKYLVCACGR